MALARLLHLGSIAAAAAAAAGAVPDTCDGDDAALQLLQRDVKKHRRTVARDHQHVAFVDSDARRAAEASRFKARTGVHPRAFAPPNGENADYDAEGTNEVEYHNFVFSDIIYNNLGGLGPDTDSPPGIRYGGVTEIGGTRIDMVLTSSGSYDTSVPDKNGLSGNLGVVNVKNDASVDFTVTFLNAETDEPVTLGKFYLGFFDIDNGQAGMQEVLTIGGFDSQLLLPGSELAVSTVGDRTAFTASSWGIGADNPIDPLMLTDLQAKRTVSLKFPAGLSSVQFTYSVTKNADYKGQVEYDEWESVGRHFLFAGMTSAYFCEATPTVMDFSMATILQNNLGGMGPNFDEPHGLILGGVAQIGDMTLDLMVTNLTEYTPKNVNRNGLRGKFGSVNMATGKETRFQFTFLQGGTYDTYTGTTDASVAVEWIYVTLYDLDAGRRNKWWEMFDINNFVTHYMTETSELAVSDLGDGRYQYRSTTHGTGRDNPRDPEELTEQQKNRATTLLLHNAMGFEATFTTGGPEGSGRNFLLSGKSSVVYC